MNDDTRQLLENVRDGKISVEEAVLKLKVLKKERFYRSFFMLPQGFHVLKGFLKG